MPLLNNQSLYFVVQAQKQWNLLVQRDNCHSFKATILLWGQIPLWICMSVALRNMAMMMPIQNLGMSTYHQNMH